MIARSMRLGVTALIGTVCIKMAALVKVSYIVGSYTAFFSGSSVAMPLMGAFGGFTGALATTAIGLLMAGSLSFKILAYHIPGLFAAWYWTTSGALIRVLVPVSCFMLFVMHPVGSQAWPYALYWFIPVILFFAQRTTLFMQALGSTFIAHAVGSVIWLYAVPMQPQAWLALIPLVAFERLVFASGMVAVHMAITWLKQLAPQAVVGLQRLKDHKA